eukprot:350708-Chlamydomonas_euryale.AAC.7
MASVARSLVRDAERFFYGFGKSFGVIMASEIGDKTFFIAAVRRLGTKSLAPRANGGAAACACAAPSSFLTPPHRAADHGDAQSAHNSLCWRNRRTGGDDGAVRGARLGSSKLGGFGHVDGSQSTGHR